MMAGELNASIDEARATISRLREKPRLSKKEARELELALALRDHRDKISELELRQKIRAGWR